MSIPLVIGQVAEGRAVRQLRRYVSGDWTACPVSGYHNAVAQIGEVTDPEQAAGDNWPHHDPRWPAACECGYQFTDADQWQRHDTRILALPDGTEFTWWGSFGRAAPPGTMIRAEWADEFYRDRHPQHIDAWLVSLPGGGEWMTSQPATDGQFWTVTGTPPGITVLPSIWFSAPHGWHGWIRDGHLDPA